MSEHTMRVVARVVVAAYRAIADLMLHPVYFSAAMLRHEQAMIFGVYE